MAINLKHSSTLYVNHFDPITKALELLLIKKEVIVTLSYDPVPAANVHAPAFTHNKFLVFGPLNTLEFLIDFFPEPRAFPNDPTNRAIHRMVITDILDNMYPLYDTNLEELSRKLNASVTAITDTDFFLNNSVYAIDCLLAPLLCKCLPTNNLAPELIRYTMRLEEFFEKKKRAQEIYEIQQRAEYSSWH